MSGNPHLYLLSKTLRNRSTIDAFKMMATRGGGGGHWHRPDPQLPKPYVHTRRIHLEDINTILYHDYSPEYHMHLHSHFIQNAKQGVSLITAYFFLIILPVWFFYSWLQKIAGSMMAPAIRPGKDHEHMAPALMKHLREHNYENTTDALGRRTAAYYKNYVRQCMEIEYKPKFVKMVERHGFKF